jgi:hypothetical protein
MDLNKKWITNFVVRSEKIKMQILDITEKDNIDNLINNLDSM